jgi:non-heme chloroperoxidase
MTAVPRLEIRSRLPARESARPPLLFVHGGYCDAWCWEPYFLPWFAAKGYAAHAVSLRGHGASAGADTLYMAGLADYEADVEWAAAQLPSPPILIGHSMGAAIVELIVAKRPVRGAALLAPIPPSGLLSVATRLATQHPGLHDADGRPGSVAPLGRRARGAAPVLLRRTTSTRACSRRLHATLTASRRARCSTCRCGSTGRCLVATRLRCSSSAPRGIASAGPDDVRATARHHGVEAVVLPGLAHMLMLEPGYASVAAPDAALAAHAGVAARRQSGRRPDHASPSSARTPATSTRARIPVRLAVASAAARSRPPSGMPIAARLVGMSSSATRS